MLEVEMKFKVNDRADLRSALINLGYKPLVERREKDIYFNAPDRDFAKTDEVLRVREINKVSEFISGIKYLSEHDPAAVLTYKGPKLGNLGKIRIETESLLDWKSVDKFVEILKHLGYNYSLTVIKQREFFYKAGSNIEVTLDGVDGLGDYIELEIKSETSEEAFVELQELATVLNLGPEERQAYVQMLLVKNGNDTSKVSSGQE